MPRDEHRERATTLTPLPEHGHGGRTRAIQRTLLGVLALNVLVGGAKLGYGLLTGSLAMTADGVNSLMDGASNVVGLVAIAVASRPPDPNHPYGHRRFETLTSLAIALFMLLALQEILQSAWHRWQTGAAPTVTALSFAVMLGTLVINLFVAAWERRAGHRLRSSILLADARHTATDVFVTLSVIGGLVAIRLGLPEADLVIALLIALVIAWGAWTIIRDAALSLSDVAPVPAPEIARAARAVPGVEGVHNIRSRGGEGLIWVDMHIQVDPTLRVDEAHDIASDVAARVEQALGEPTDVTVHVEPANPRHLRPTRGYQPDELARVHQQRDRATGS
ncbi:cation diffusion facilitator family transporter [Sphaerobacter thermophilus]|uniref:Cation diffusion facilitator family transporter n=1 Tax=Sphaerobacter thermophilus (strain ATCC 49802 / DSM 20745 / KCCM 41009 / NCIMB 13125 / S 6022) TaxID=479434 RepID=D1C9G1_SPHTD|nr:cation diffusion facilitator family transporter [Sphaerobacter thermophilus]ACZ40454.1 cation diffusion facilitator family transporter [Sphaerobacter thermophilus DSM 20745]